MLNLFKDILASDAGSATFVASLLIGGGWLIYYITKKVTIITSSHSTLSKSIEKIDSNMDEVRKDLAFLKGSLDVVKQANNNALTQAHSPISLTQKGKDVAKELGVDQMIANNWDTINSTIEQGVEGKNPYDIQQYCIEQVSVFPEKFFLVEDLQKIKLYAYRSGESLTLYTRMIAVVIRDIYFEKHNIPTSDIDKHDPSNIPPEV